MIVKAKEREEIYFKDIKVGQVFREYGEEPIYMKVSLEDDFICCPECGEDFHINNEKSMVYAVDLNYGHIYEFSSLTIVEIVQGAFIEE